MDTQLSFSETEKNKIAEPARTRILAIGHNQDELVTATELLTKSIPNASITTSRYGIDGIKKEATPIDSAAVAFAEWSAEINDRCTLECKAQRCMNWRLARPRRRPRPRCVPAEPTTTSRRERLLFSGLESKPA